MSQRRVVVTGLGAVSPLGNSVRDTWSGVTQGVSGVRKLDRLVKAGCEVSIAADVKDFNPSVYITPKDIRRLDHFIQYGIAAGVQAVDESGVMGAGYDCNRMGVVMGSGVGGISTIEQAAVAYHSNRQRVSPFFIPSIIINMVSGHLSIRYNFRGANLALATACTTSTHAIGLAARLIRWGELDTAVAGGAEAVATATTIAAFTAMKALSRRINDPTKASRPWDRNRDGFVLGNGAGALMLEEYNQAKSRGAHIYGEIIGFGMSADAYHITSPVEDGTGFYASMFNAVKDADIVASDVDYINAHGTSTFLGDRAETAAIKKLFGDDTKVPVSSTKSMFGHLLGAAGAVEAIVTLLAMKDSILPPTINLEDPDDGCDLDYVANEARDGKLKVTMSNSFGFGGTNGTLVMRTV